jgi:dihydroorotate dehydrogenase electron transfer subunit
MTKCNCKTKAAFDTLVLDNVQFGKNLYKLTLQLSGIGAEVFIKAVPGQFAEFDARFVSLPPADRIPGYLADKARRQMILRRPFSFSRIEPQGEYVIIDVLYLVLGPSTLRLSTLKKDDKLGLIGPLGNGFWVPSNKKLAIIVAGGMGAPPLQHLAAYLKSTHPEMNLVAFAGARSSQDLPFEIRKPLNETELTMVLAEFARHGIQSHISTDDGSLGFKGYVTDSLSHWLAKNPVNRA